MQCGEAQPSTPTPRGLYLPGHLRHRSLSPSTRQPRPRSGVPDGAAAGHPRQTVSRHRVPRDLSTSSTNGTQSPAKRVCRGSPWISRTTLLPLVLRVCPRDVTWHAAYGRALGTGRQPAARAAAEGRCDGARAVALIPNSATRQFFTAQKV